MPTVDQSIRAVEQDLAYVRDKVQRILRTWDSKTPNELLAEDVVLSISLGAPGKSLIGSLPFGNKVQVTGREEAKRVLSTMYNHLSSDLRSGLSVTTEVVSGYEVVLLGELALPPSAKDHLSVPIILYMVFDDEGRIEQLTIAGGYPERITKAIRIELRKQLPLGGPK